MPFVLVISIKNPGGTATVSAISYNFPCFD